MSPWAIYFLGIASIAFPINYYFKNKYGEKNPTLTTFLSLFWIVIPFFVLLNVINPVSKIKSFINFIKKQGKNNDT